MARKGRPAGSTSRYCLIQDELTHTYLKVVAETQNTVGYYASFPHLLRSILKEKHVPQGKNGQVYNLSQYVEAMNKLANAMAKILVPPHHRVTSKSL